MMTSIPETVKIFHTTPARAESPFIKKRTQELRFLVQIEVKSAVEFERR